MEVHSRPPSSDAFPDPLTWETVTVASPSKDDSASKKELPAAGMAAGTEGAPAESPGAMERRMLSSEAPSVIGQGYRSGKWLWEWQVVSCGNRASVGVCGHDVAAVSAAGVPVQGSGEGGGGEGGGGGDEGRGGDRADLWMYRSDGHLSHGGESTERVCPGGGFDSSDVVGVELDADAGTVAFLKNDSYVGGQFKIVRQSDKTAAADVGGLYPCVSLRGSGDAVELLGLKEGSGTITYRSPPKDESRAGESNRDSPKPSGDGIAAALSAAVAVATAAAEAIAAAAAATVGGGDVAALEAAEAAAASESAAAVMATDEDDTGDGSDDREHRVGSGAGASPSAGSPDEGSAAATGVSPTHAVSADDGGGDSSAAADGATAESSSDSSAAGDDAPLTPVPTVVSTAPPAPLLYPACFHGEFVRGLKHGPGVLKLSGKGGYWRGKWFQGVQHGVHLLVEPPAKKGQPEDDGTPTAWVFDRGVKVCLCVCFCFVV